MARNKVQFQKGMSEALFDGSCGTGPLCHAALVRRPGVAGREHSVNPA